MTLFSGTFQTAPYPYNFLEAKDTGEDVCLPAACSSDDMGQDLSLLAACNHTIMSLGTRHGRWGLKLKNQPL